MGLGTLNMGWSTFNMRWGTYNMGLGTSWKGFGSSKQARLERFKIRIAAYSVLKLAGTISTFHIYVSTNFQNTNLNIFGPDDAFPLSFVST